MLKCVKCGRLIEKLPEGSLRCAYCPGRVLSKPRKSFVKRVRAV